MHIFTFTGWSGTGKTTLISALIRELSERGWNITAVKKAPEKIHLEPEGKDSRHFLDSGAQSSILVTKNRFMKMKPMESPGEILMMEEEELLRSDFVLMEGKITENAHFIEVFDPDISDSPKTRPEQLSAVISDDSHFHGVPHFNRNRISEIADFLEILANKREVK